MDTLRLSPRLRTVAELVPQGARVIDVGTDHAMIPVWLVQTGRASHVWASDLRPGPLDSAARLLRETETTNSIDLRLADGLAGFSRSDGDTVIIAGMGGETMISILEPAAWVREDVLLILEPQSKQELLRRWLSDNGLCIDSERLVRDAGRIYPVLTARGGVSPACSEAELHTGRWELIGSDPLLPEYLAILQKRISPAAPYDPRAQELLVAFRSMEERWKAHDDYKRDI